MAEHLKERVSGYLGTAKTLGSTSRKVASTAGCLEGNWNEERFDSRAVATGGKRAALPTELDHTWRTEYTHMADTRAPPTAAQRATQDQLSATTRRLLTTLSQPGANPLSQSRLVDIVDGRHRAYPGHQPEQDPKSVQEISNTLTTETRQAFIKPKERILRQQTNAQDTYPGPAHNKAQFVIYKVRQQLEHRIPEGKIPKLGGTPEAIIRCNFAFPALRRCLYKAECHAPIPGLTKIDGRITLDELQRGLTSYGINLAPDELSVLFTHFDTDASGEVDVQDVVRGIRGELNDRRRGVVHRAYKLIASVVGRKTAGETVQVVDKKGQIVTPVYGRDLFRLFDGASHPETLAGRCTAEFAFYHLFDDYAAADAKKRAEMEKTIFTLELFTELYEDWGALVPADYTFEHAVRNCWHLSGGEGLARNTSCRRVEVVHTNGRITMEEIIDDLGIDASDEEGMTRNLEHQGIKDVKRIGKK